MLLGRRARARSAAAPEPVSAGRRIAALRDPAVDRTASSRTNTATPVAGAMVSALGATTTVRRDRSRRPLRARRPCLRARTCCVPTAAAIVAPRSADRSRCAPSARTASSIALRRADAPAVLAAGSALAWRRAGDPSPSIAPQLSATGAGRRARTITSETAWRLRHARRGILKDADAADRPARRRPDRTSAAGRLLRPRVGSPARAATSFFADTPFSGQVNLLTTGSFDTPQQLFSGDNLSRGIAYIRVGAPVGAQATGRSAARSPRPTSRRGSWPGSYTTPRAGAASLRRRHVVQHAALRRRQSAGAARRDRRQPQRRHGLRLRHVRDHAGLVGRPTARRYARYDYLEQRSLLSPRVELTSTPADDASHQRAIVSRRAHAPGAEEFLPPGDTRHLAAAAADLLVARAGPAVRGRARPRRWPSTSSATSARRRLAFARFRQHVDDQLVTLFGADMPEQPGAKLGHYLVGNAGDVDATGCTASSSGRRSPAACSGSVAYSLAQRADSTPARRSAYLVLLAPSAMRPGAERIHDCRPRRSRPTCPRPRPGCSSSIASSNGFARPRDGDASAIAGVDSRFDVQVRQSLPFMNFTQRQVGDAASPFGTSSGKPTATSPSTTSCSSSARRSGSSAASRCILDRSLRFDPQYLNMRRSIFWSHRGVCSVDCTESRLFSVYERSSDPACRV